MKTIITIILFIVFISCSSTNTVNLKPAVNVKSKPKKETKVDRPVKSSNIFKKATHEFATKDGQDRADMKLALYEDKTFKFWLSVLSPENQSQSYTEFSGKWQEIDDYIQIIFIKEKPILKALIDEENETVILINESSFKFQKDVSEIILWGLYLDRI